MLKTRSADLIRRAHQSSWLQRQALLLLKYLARGDQDHREGRIMSDQEADVHFRAKLAAMKPGG